MFAGAIMLTAGASLMEKMLFFEPRLSKSGLVNCNFCHNIDELSFNVVTFKRVDIG